MSAIGTLAGELVEFGGDLHTHSGWLARRADGTHVDGYRYAAREAHTCGADCDTPCPGWHWHYVGRAFASEDAVTVLAEIVGDDGPMTTHGLAPVPAPNRGSGPVDCDDPTCRGHRARCLFGRQHRWVTWYENGRLMRTEDTYHCYECGGVCIGDESTTDRPAAPS